MAETTEVLDDTDGTGTSKPDGDIFMELERQVDPICMDARLAQLVSEGRKAVILQAAMIHSHNQSWIAHFVIRNFRDFLNENSEILMNFIVHHISLFPSVLIDFVLDRLVKAQRFQALSYVRQQNPNPRIRYAARDLLDANVDEITDPGLLAIIGAIGLDKAARRTAIEKLAQGRHISFLNFIAVMSGNPQLPPYYDADIAALARKAQE